MCVSVYITLCYNVQILAGNVCHFLGGLRSFSFFGQKSSISSLNKQKKKMVTNSVNSLNSNITKILYIIIMDLNDCYIHIIYNYIS